MQIPPLSWLTPLQNFRPRGRAGRPRKVNSALKARLEALYQQHSIIEISRMTKLNRNTISHHLGRQDRG